MPQKMTWQKMYFLRRRKTDELSPIDLLWSPSWSCSVKFTLISQEKHNFGTIFMSREVNCVFFSNAFSPPESVTTWKFFYGALNIELKVIIILLWPVVVCHHFNENRFVLTTLCPEKWRFFLSFCYWDVNKLITIR